MGTKQSPASLGLSFGWVGGGVAGVNCQVVFPTHFNPNNFLLILLHTPIHVYPRINAILRVDMTPMVLGVCTLVVHKLSTKHHQEWFMFDTNLDTLNFNRKSSFYSRSLKKLLPRKKELVRQTDHCVLFMLSRFSIKDVAAYDDWFLSYLNSIHVC